jgi:molybdopterin biosynthesis enzyme MoaB
LFSAQSYHIFKSAIVADEVEHIQSIVKEWVDAGTDLVVCTGGTGFGQRDVTPEVCLS